jgi:structural maintenance of chromosome 1
MGIWLMISRSQANTLVVTERQQLETLRREKKTLTDALASVQDKIQQAETKQTQLRSEIERLAEREEEVSFPRHCRSAGHTADK